MSDADELEPLFDYSRVQPIDLLSDDSDSESPSILAPKRLKKSHPVDPVDCETVNDVDEDEEDWLPPPPNISNDVRRLVEEDETLKKLRLKKQELASFAQSAEDVLRAVEEFAEKKCSNAEPSLDSEIDKPSKLQDDRVKIVVSIQDKDGLKQFRIYKDEKFERLFKMYAEKVKREVGSLVFSFDGDKVNPTATPAGLDMEDNDIIEVRVK